jgi:type I restriction enzyme S subunit
MKTLDGWMAASLGELLVTRNNKTKQIKSTEYSAVGSFPVIDQSAEFICGYHDNSAKLIDTDLPLTVFGDHTRHTKFIDFPFIAGADGTQLLKSKRGIQDKFFYYLVASAADKIGNFGYDRHFKHLKEYVCGYPLDESEQAKIAEILSTVDRAIEQTEALIAKQQRIKTGLMQDLLTRGIDEHGNLRSEQTHKFKDSPLGRIPVEWEVETFANITPSDAPIGYGIVQPGAYDFAGVRVAGIFTINSDFNTWHMSSPKIEQAYVRSRIRSGDVLLSIKGTTGRVGVVPEGITGNISRDIARIRPVWAMNPYFLRFLMLSDFFQQYINNAQVGTTRAEISIKILRLLYILIPSRLEQDIIVSIIISSECDIDSSSKELDKLRLVKTALMQDLLTGNKRVTSLLSAKEVSLS